MRALVAFSLFFLSAAAAAQSGVSRDVSWINATEYTDGSPLAVGTFDTVIVINGIEAARVPSTETSVRIDDVPWGTSDYWAYHVDSNGVVGLNSDVFMDYVQPIPGPPSGVTVQEVLAALREACNAPGNPNAFREVCELLAAL